jgi:hypothetical protein
VGAAVRRSDLLAKAVCQAKNFPLENRFREQARSHRDLISTEKTHKKSGNRVNGCHFFERRDYLP